VKLGKIVEFDALIRRFSCRLQCYEVAQAPASRALRTGGILRTTVADKPTSTVQRYVPTEAGIQLTLLHEQAVVKPDEENGY
jgi:hypothetical protein